MPLDQLNPPLQSLSGQSRHWALASLQQRMDLPDQVDDNLMNRVLWHAARGDDVAYPAAWAGAHGRGLAKLGLRLDAQRAIHKDDDDE